MSASRRPWMKFYPADWRSDQALRLCSLAARGLWIECMSIMHEVEDRHYGELQVNGSPLTESQLAVLVGAGGEEVKTLLSELEQAGVFSRTRQAVIYSRRMVRDEKRVAAAKIAGGAGGNPKLKRGYNKPGFIYVIGMRADGAYKIGISVNPRNRLKKIRQQYPGHDLHVLNEFPVQDMGFSESVLHAKFTDKRSGEWFFLNQADLCYIKENTSTFKGPVKGEEKGRVKANRTKNLELRKEEGRIERVSTSEESDAAHSPAVPPEELEQSDSPDRSEPDNLTEVGDQVLSLCGIQPETWLHDFHVIASWLRTGADPDVDIYPTVKRLVDDNPNFTPPRSARGLAYFTEAVVEAKGRRLDGPNGSDPDFDPERSRWEGRVSGYFKRQFWIIAWGPEPGQPGCQAPEEIVEKYRRIEP